MAKKTRAKTAKRTSSARKAARPKTRSRKTASAGRKTTRKAARTTRKAVKKARKAVKKTARAARKAVRKIARKASAKRATRPAARKKTAARKTPKTGAPGRKTGASRSNAGATRKQAGASRKGQASRRGGTGRESELDQTPQTGRSVKGPTNPKPTRRSTGTPAGAGTTRHASLDRERRQLRELEEEIVETPPSSLDRDRSASAARSGRRHMQDELDEHTESSPALTGGDVDADWQDAYAVGDEAPGGDNPTPDQDRVDDIGKALGVTYDDNEELKASDKIAERDKHRWELDPASSDDYRDRD